MFVVTQDRSSAINLDRVKQLLIHGNAIYADELFVGIYDTRENAEKELEKILEDAEQGYFYYEAT